MFGFIIGLTCLVGLVKVVRGGGRCGHRAWGGESAFGGHRWRRGRWGGPYRSHENEVDEEPSSWRERRRWRRYPYFLRMLFEQLETTPDQEKKIRQAVEEVVDSASVAQGEVRRSRADIAAALRSDGFDEALMGELFSRHDDVIQTARKSFVGLVAKVHEALDDDQRKRLARLIERGPRWGAI